MDEFKDIAEETPAEDVIKSFLAHKTNEIKQLTKEAEKELKLRKEHREKCLNTLKEEQNFGNSDLKITGCWQKIYNEKWIIGIHTKNQTERAATNIQILLKCDVINSLVYDTKIYTKNLEQTTNIEQMEIDNSFEYKPTNDEWIETKELNKESVIIILINPPSLTAVEYKFSGIMLYEKTQIFQVSLPEVTFSVAKLNNNDYHIKHNDVLNGVVEAYLSILSCSVTNVVKIKIPDGIYRTVGGLVELDCFFMKMQVESSSKFYLYDGNTEQLKGCIIQLKGEDVILFTKNSQQFKILLHHLYTQIPDVTISDSSCQVATDLSLTLLSRTTQSFLNDTRPANQEGLQNFITSLDRQLELVEKTLANRTEVNEKEYKIFRNTLCDMEKDTDCLYLKLNEFEK